MASQLKVLKLRVSARRGAASKGAAIVLAAALIAFGLASPAYSAPPEEHPHSRDHVLVKLQPGFQADQVLGRGSDKVFGRWRVQPVPPGRSLEELVDTLESRPGVEDVELDYVMQLDPVEGDQLSSSSVASSAVINDPYFSYQWHFPAIQLEEAWAKSTGAGIVVAIVDSGISRAGDDLADCHTFVAPYNAITQTTGAAAAEDDSGHGTHVAGTVAQCTNNGKGVAGVAFRAALMPVKVLDGGSGFASWIARGIDWARTHGADVINLSLGCADVDCPPHQRTVMDDAIEAAVSEGIVVVAASGNDADVVSYPANHPDVIAVGATDYNDQRAPYSNSGSALDVVAPGGDTTRDANGDDFGDGVLQESFNSSDEWGYYFFQGTSMATPHVSGTVALLLSRFPDMDRSIVEQVLTETAFDLGPSGFDESFGHGLVRPDLVLAYDTAAPTWPSGATLDVDRFAETSLAVTWDPASDNKGVSAYQLRVEGKTWTTQQSRNTTVTELEPGIAYEFEVKARDQLGNWSQPLRATLRTSRAFTDTPGTTFYNDILWMSGKDITRGCNPPANDMFCPDDPVTRGQMAAFVVRALGLTVDDHPGFVDVPEDSTFAGDIGRLATAGITRGCNPPTNDRFCPNDPVTRGQFAAFFHRGLG